MSDTNTYDQRSPVGLIVPCMNTIESQIRATIRTISTFMLRDVDVHYAIKHISEVKMNVNDIKIACEDHGQVHIKQIFSEKAIP